MPALTRTGLTYPARGQSRHFEILKRFYDGIDSILYAHREDRNIVLLGGGTIGWNATSGELSWDSDFIIFSPQRGYHEIIEVANSPVTIGDGSLLYVTLTRSPSQQIVLVPHVSNVVPQDDNSVLLALRSGTDLYWRNGLVMGDDYSGILATAPGSQKSYEFLSIADAVDGSVPPAAASDLVDSAGRVKIRKFDSSTSEDVAWMWNVPMDADVSAGIKVKVKSFISEATGPSGEGVSFLFTVYPIADGDPLSYGGTPASQWLAKTGMTLSQYDAALTAFGAQLDPPSMAPGDSLAILFARDPSQGDDDYAQDIGVVGVEIEYTKRPV